MPFAPIDYGPAVQADTQGLQAQETAVARREVGVFGAARQMGENIVGASREIAQGILHNQALQASAAVKENQAQTLKFIESNPYVSKDQLKQMMPKDDFEAWHASLSPEYMNSDKVPMHTVAGELFDSSAKQARAHAGELIALPGWRTEWEASERTESATIRERYVNRMAADQLVSDQRAKALDGIDRLLNANDFSGAFRAAQTNPWLRPAEREHASLKVRALKDAFPVDEAIRTNNVDAMGKALTALQAPDAAERFPNLDERQRADLTQRLERAYGYHAARQLADDMVSKYTDQQAGRVDSVNLNKEVLKYDKPNREEVIKAVKLREDEGIRLFNMANADIQSTIHTAGQDPRTGLFSMSRAQGATLPDGTKVSDLAAKLNQNAPGMLTALANIDDRLRRAADMRDRRAAKAEDDKQAVASSVNSNIAEQFLKDEGNRTMLAQMTPSQWSAYLFDESKFPGGFRPEAHTALMKAFDAFQARVKKPDERVPQSINAVIADIARGNKNDERKLLAKYSSMLTVAAHSYLEEHAGEASDKLTDGLRERLKKELIRGDVLDTGIFNDTVRRVEFETNPNYRGKKFKLKDGSLLNQDGTIERPDGSVVREVERDGQTRLWDVTSRRWVD